MKNKSHRGMIVSYLKAEGTKGGGIGFAKEPLAFGEFWTMKG
ncbi:hypothetical protein [Cohnella sp. LGH]|nr:hypothetical protein [Cohnella sp. LGH]